MTPQRCRVLTLTGLVPAALITLLGMGGVFTRPEVGLAVVAGAAVTLASFAAVLRFGLAGVAPRRAVPAIGVLTWGGFVLTAALGEMAQRAAFNALAQMERGSSPWPNAQRLHRELTVTDPESGVSMRILDEAPFLSAPSRSGPRRPEPRLARRACRRLHPHPPRGARERPLHRRAVRHPIRGPEPPRARPRRSPQRRKPVTSTV